MRIRSLRIDGFGIHRGLVLGPLAPGVQVVAGPNEAGKSTLLAFLRWMLFAPWSGRGVNPPLPPLRGGTPGGELELDGPGGAWRLTRRVEGRRREFRLFRPDGSEGDGADLSGLLGGATPDLFEKVFLFDLADLAEIRGLAGKSLEGRLLAAGLTGAGTGARELARELSARARELVAPRGDCRLKRLLDRHAELAERLRSLRSAAAAAADRREERAVVAEVEALEKERKNLSARLSFLEALEELAEIRARAASRRREREELPLDDRLHALAPRAGELARDLSAARAAREEAAELEERRAGLEARFREQLASLGEGGDPARLEALPPSEVLREEGLRLARARDEARARLREARSAAEAARARERAVLEEPAPPGAGIAGLLPWVAAGPAFAAGLWLLATGVNRGAGVLALVAAAVLGVAAFLAGRRRRRAAREAAERRDAAAAERRRAEREVREAERRAAEADRAWDAFLGERGLPAVEGMDGLVGFLDRAREARATLAERARVEQALADRRRRVEAWCAGAAALLGEAGLPVPGEDGPAGDDDPLPRLAAAIRDLSSRIEEEARARVRAGEIEAVLRELEERERNLLAGRDPAAIDRELADRTPDARRAEREEVRARLEEIEETLGRLRERLGAIRGERRRIEGDGSIPALEQELRSRVAELAEVVADWQRLALGEALVREALRRFRERHQPAVLRRASEWLGEMTAGRHPVVRTGEDGEGLEILGPGGEALGPDRLSRGTREQLWLALRLALAVDVAARGPAPPLVLDDVLVDFDPGRRAAAARVLARVGREVQVLVLTCHPDLADLLAREAGAAVTELPALSP